MSKNRCVFIKIVCLKSVCFFNRFGKKVQTDFGCKPTLDANALWTKTDFGSKRTFGWLEGAKRAEVSTGGLVGRSFFIVFYSFLQNY